MNNSIGKCAKLAAVFCILCLFMFPLAIYATAIEEVEISFTVGAEHYIVTVGDYSGFIHVPIVRNRLTLNEGQPVTSREMIAQLLGIRQVATAQNVTFTRADGQEHVTPLNAISLEDVARFAGATSIVWNGTNQTISFTIERALTPVETRRLNRSPFMNENRERLTLAQLLEQAGRAMPHIDTWNRAETPFPILQDRHLNANELANWRVRYDDWGITEREISFVHRINEERGHRNVEGLIICPYLSQLARFNVQSQLDIGSANIASNHVRYGETVSVEYGRIFGITTTAGRFTLGSIINVEPNVSFMRNLEQNYRVIYNTLIAGRLRYIGVGSVNNVIYILVADPTHAQNYS
jgi:hypothetical protein